MSMEIFLKIREMGKAVKERRKDEVIDYHDMTAPCGLACFECYLYLAQFDEKMSEMIAGLLNVTPDLIKCKGCRGQGGKCAHHAADGVECRVYPCIENKDMHTCAECGDFPCEYLHPYMDHAEYPHNTKVYNLCRIKKLGLEKWAKEEAGDILDKYYYGQWTL